MFSAWVIVGAAILFVVLAVAVGVEYSRPRHPRRHGVEMSDEDVRRLENGED